MAVPKGFVRINGLLYPTDMQGRVKVKDKETGRVQWNWPVDAAEIVKIGAGTLVDEGEKERLDGEVKQPASSAATGPAADIPERSGVTRR